MISPLKGSFAMNKTLLTDLQVPLIALLQKLSMKQKIYTRRNILNTASAFQNENIVLIPNNQSYSVSL